MVYTSFIEPRRGEFAPGKYDSLSAALLYATQKEGVAFVLNLQKIDAEKIPRGRHVKEVVDMGDSLDVIVETSPSAAMAVAEAIHRKTSQRVGIAQYKVGEDPAEVQAKAEIARDIAEEKGTVTHLYDPDADSPSALLRH
jgi:hypothetical protein